MRPERILRTICTRSIAALVFSSLTVLFILMKSSISIRGILDILTTEKGPCKTVTNMSSCIGDQTDFNSGFDNNWSFEPPKRLISVCQNKDSKPVLVFVPIAPHMFAQRNSVRNTWASGFNHVVFLLQLRTGYPISQNLSNEVNKFDDIFIVRAPAKDSYKCLTLKVLAFLRWFRSRCSHAFHYLLKSDHDSYWHAKSVLRLLHLRVMRIRDQKRMSSLEIIGAIQKRAPVNRDPNSKFCTPMESYASSHFPTYASGGPGYLLSRQAAVVLVEKSKRSTAPAPFWLEDVFITGMLVETAVTFNNNSMLAAANSLRILLLDSSRIHIWKLSQTEFFNNPPLAVHGLTMLQLHQIDCRIRWPLEDDRAKNFMTEADEVMADYELTDSMTTGTNSDRKLIIFGFLLAVFTFYSNFN